MVNRVGIAGGSGYTGIELIRILLGHPEVEIAFITSEKNAGQKVSSVSPSFSKILNLDFISVDQGLKQSCDLVFVAPETKTQSQSQSQKRQKPKAEANKKTVKS